MAKRARRKPRVIADHERQVMQRMAMGMYEQSRDCVLCPNCKYVSDAPSKGSTGETLCIMCDSTFVWWRYPKKDCVEFVTMVAKKR